MTAAERSTASLGPHPQYPKSVKPGVPRLSGCKPGWRRVLIGELFEVVSRPVEMCDEKTYKLVTVKRSRGGVTEREQLLGSQIAVKSQYYIEAGDFLVSKRQIVHGACAFVPAEMHGAIVSNEYAVLKCKGIVLPEFLEYLIHTPYFQQTCFHSSIGVHVEKMIFKLDEWFKWPIYLPSMVEQERIASFLKLVDEKLCMLNHSHNLLTGYKRSVVREIYSQNARFKKSDGSNYPAWTTKKLREVSERKIVKNNDSEIYRVLTNSATNGIVDQQDYFDKEIANVNNLDGYYVVDKGDYVYNPRISVHAPVGPINKNKVGRGVMSPLYTIFSFNSDNNSFYEHYFKTTLWHRYMSSVANYGARHDRMNISSSDFMDMPIPYPHPDEQKVIVEFIDSINLKIKLSSQFLDNMELFKKGLIQKMFD